LPVPLSPVIRTRASEAAIIRTSASRSAMQLERLTISERHASSSPPVSGTSVAGVAIASAASTLSSSALPSNGLVR